MRKKLTKKSLESIKPTPRRTYVYDTELPGFGAVVLPSGGKTFFIQFRTAGGRRGHARRMKLGTFGPLTVDEARALARKQLALVAQGHDPASRRAAEKAVPTVAELGMDFLAAIEARRKPDTAKEYRRLWTKHIVHVLGSLKVSEVSVTHVEQLHRGMRATPYQGNRTLALLSVFFSFAEARSIRARHSNPARDVEPYRERARERYLTPEEVHRLGEALTAAVSQGVMPAPNRRRPPATGLTARHRPKTAGSPRRLNPFAVAAIRLLALTGMREKEALRLRWSEVDLQRGIITLEDTKTGRSVRPIGAPAVALLASLPRLEGSAFVFPGASPGRSLVEINRVWYAVRNAAGLHDVRLHDLRHSFASMAAGAGGSLLMIGALLGHRNPSTTKRYAHLASDPLRTTADDTANGIARLLMNAADADNALGSPGAARSQP